MAINYYLLNTFSNEKFKGNPTPVCLLEAPLSIDTMLLYTKEFNAPVTAFVEPKNINDVYRIRYFTITGEIPACGHATLGASFVLFNSTKNNQIIFETIEKIRLLTRQDNGKTFVEYPKYESTTINIPVSLESALGLEYSLSNFFCKELESLFIELHRENEVKQLSPNFKQLTESTDKTKEVVVMSKAENKYYDVVLRSFCPWIGIDEDPVTGSIHSVLGHYWKNRLNKNEFTVYQASERGGLLYIKTHQNTVEIGGHNTVIIVGKLNE